MPFVSAAKVRAATQVPGATSVAFGADHRTVTGPRYHPSHETGAGEHSTNTGVGVALAVATSTLPSTMPSNTGGTPRLAQAGARSLGESLRCDELCESLDSPLWAFISTKQRR
jgi:hypothetical protein